MCRLIVPLEDIRQAAADARINLSAQEEAALEKQLAGLLKQLSYLKENGLEQVEPTYYPYKHANTLREDVVQPSLPLETVMLNAPEADADFFHVPKIVE